MSNNKFSSMPAMMSDGRWLSNPVPTPSIDEVLKNRFGVPDNFEYRRYLQKNADNIIYDNFMTAYRGNQP